MSVMVKICGLHDAAGVAAAVESGVGAIGFVFTESVRRVTPQQANDVSRHVSKEVQRVAVMRHPANDEWHAVLDEFAPDVLQTDIEDFDALEVPDSVIRWPVVRESSAALESELPDVFVYEGANSGRGETVDWPRAAVIARRGRMILAGGLSAGNIAAAISAVDPWGVDVSSAVESRPGKKDPDLIRQFIQAVRAAETGS
jgi:phosphoribosylanthranilate isomerase